ALRRQAGNAVRHRFPHAAGPERGRLRLRSEPVRAIQLRRPELSDHAGLRSERLAVGHGTAGRLGHAADAKPLRRVRWRWLAPDRIARHWRGELPARAWAWASVRPENWEPPVASWRPGRGGARPEGASAAAFA